LFVAFGEGSGPLNTAAFAKAGCSDASLFVALAKALDWRVGNFHP